MPKLSIVIPAYNERATIEELLQRVLEAPIPESLERQLIVVDDGSSDGTRKLLRELEKSGPYPFRLIEHPQNRGKGAALRTGFDSVLSDSVFNDSVFNDSVLSDSVSSDTVTGDIILVQDADLEYNPRDYPVLLQPILDDEADVVYGSRFLGGPHRVLFFWHYVGNRVLTTLSNMMTDLNLSDMETCYKVFRTEVLRGMKLESERFGIEPELTAKIAKSKARIYEVPISYHGRTYAEGKKIGWKDGVSALWAILRYNLGS